MKRTLILACLACAIAIVGLTGVALATSPAPEREAEASAATPAAQAAPAAPEAAPAPKRSKQPAPAATKPDVRRAVAILEARSGSKLSGRALFTEHGGKITLRLDVQGIAPGLHAAHLHEKGDCGAPDAASSGPHWNPSGEAHGKMGTAPFHHGDIGNIIVDSGGKGTLVMTTDLWTLGGPEKTNILGKAVIVHANQDDFKTQPTGNAGGRIGCGVIKME